MTSPAAPVDRLLVGRYRFTRVLGRGGMGTVWAAHDEVLGRDVAVKEVVPPPDLSEQERRVVRERSLREARAAARISHPSAVTVYDVVEEDGRPWIVMQQLRARSLADVLRDDGPLAVPRAVRLGLEVVDALGAAHAAGVLHRDVKPANVMLTEDGHAVLTDFGIATVDGDPTLTAAGLIVGSPAYMAPERARGEAPTTASDLWSLGATLYAAIEGRSPFQRDGQLPTLTAVINEPAPALPAGGPIAPVVDALLAKDPARRPTVTQARALLLGAAREAEEQAEAAAAAAAETEAAETEAAETEAAETEAAEKAEAAEQTEAEQAPTVSGPRLPPDRAGPGPGRRRIGVLAGLVLLAVVVAAVVSAVLLDGERDRSGARTGASPTSAPSATPSTSATTSATPPAGRTTPTATPSSARPGGTGDTAPTGATGVVPPSGVPAGFRLHRDPTGFSIAIPEGWTRSTESTRTYFREPGGGRFLQVDQTTDPKPDAVADWERQETAVSQRLEGYSRIHIGAVPYRGWDAADWEFTWRSGSRRIHVLSRNIRVSDERAYALYWSVPDDRWTQSRPMFDTFAATFQPAP